jgi:hypothetical protein
MHPELIPMLNSGIRFFGKHIAVEDFRKIDLFVDGSTIAYYPLFGDLKDLTGRYDAHWEGEEHCDNVGRLLVPKFPLQNPGRIKVDWIERPHDEFTISGWIYVFGYSGSWINVWHFTPNGSNCCDGPARQPALFCGSSDNRWFHVACDESSSWNHYYNTSNVIQYGRWHHIVQTIRSDRMQLYVDKNLVADIAANSRFLLYDGVLYIHDPWHNGYHRMCNVRLMSRFVGQREVDILHDDGSFIKRV